MSKCYTTKKKVVALSNLIVFVVWQAYLTKSNQIKFTLERIATIIQSQESGGKGRVVLGG